MNHVSGDPTPSSETIIMARNVGDACDRVGIPLRDFIVVGEQSFVSLAEAGKLVWGCGPAEELLASW